MRMRRVQRGYRRGTTLVEVSVGLLVFMIMALGSTYYRYFTAAEVQRAQRQLIAADLAVTALETWQGIDGDESFDPVGTFSADLAIEATDGDIAPGESVLLGGYDVTFDGYVYHLTLYWRDVEVGLRELGVTASWPIGGSGDDKTYLLTGYVRR